MKVRYEDSICYKVLERIRSLPGYSILRSDLVDLASARQISRALKKLTEQKEIVKLGYGIYGKLTQSDFNPDITFLNGGFLLTVREALSKLNIDWESSTIENDYNSGRSTQVPANPPTKINSRFSRKLTYNDRELQVE